MHSQVRLEEYPGRKGKTNMTVPIWLAVRLKNQYPMLNYFTDRTFGVEIEFYGLEYVLTPADGAIIKPYNISSKATDGRRFRQLCLDAEFPLGSDAGSWHFEEDTSVRGKRRTRYGAELISPILRGLEGLVQAYRAFQFLSQIEGVDIDRSCGFHVHHGVDRETFRCEQLKQLVKIVHPLEKLFYLLIPGNRQNAKTCRPIEIDVEAFIKSCDPRCGPDDCKVKKLLSSSDEPQFGPDDCRVKKVWYSSQNRYDPQEARYPRYDKTRYHGLNLHSYWYRSTIEFRYHSAILHHVDEAMQWIIFSQFLVELSQGHIPIISFHPNGNKWMKTIYVVYHALGYSDRIKYLSSFPSDVDEVIANQDTSGKSVSPSVKGEDSEAL